MKNILALATIATLAASAASASSYVLQENKFFDDTKPLAIELVNTAAPATLEIYSAKANTADTLLASQDLSAGVHTDIRFGELKGDVIAVLKINGTIVDQQLIERK